MFHRDNIDQDAQTCWKRQWNDETNHFTNVECTRWSPYV